MNVIAGPYAGRIPPDVGATCPECQRESNLEVRDQWPGHKGRVVTFRCPSCDGGAIGYFSPPDEDHLIYLERLTPAARAAPMPGLTGDLALYRDEAWNAHKAGLFSAATIMARAAMQLALRKAGATGRDLRAEIEGARSKGLITAALKDAADEVRFAGNERAHPEDVGAVSPVDSEEILVLMDDLLNALFAMQARIDAVRARRT